MPRPDAASSRQRWSAALGIAISVGLLAWALRGVSISDVIEHLRAAHPAPLLLAVIFATLTFALRLIRWLLLLRDEHGGRYPAGPLWHAIAMGFAANNVLPLRAGELVRTYAATRLTSARFSTVLSSVAVERIFDALAVVTLLTVALLSPDLPPQVSVGGQSVANLARAGAVASAVGLLLAIMVVASPLGAERIVRRMVPFPSLANRLVSVIEGVRQGLIVLRTPGRLLAVVFWSLVLWLLNGFAFYVGFAAFDIPVSYLGALLMQGLLVLGISLPSTPGFFGPFEAVIVAVLAIYGIPKEVAFSYAIAFHVCSFVPITLLGLWSLARNPGAVSVRRGVEA